MPDLRMHTQTKYTKTRNRSRANTRAHKIAFVHVENSSPKRHVDMRSAEMGSRSRLIFITLWGAGTDGRACVHPTTAHRSK